MPIILNPNGMEVFKLVDTESVNILLRWICIIFFTRILSTHKSFPMYNLDQCPLKNIHQAIRLSAMSWLQICLLNFYLSELIIFTYHRCLLLIQEPLLWSDLTWSGMMWLVYIWLRKLSKRPSFYLSNFLIYSLVYHIISYVTFF